MAPSAYHTLNMRPVPGSLCSCSISRGDTSTLPPEFHWNNTNESRLFTCMIPILERYRYMRVVLNSFIWKNAIFAKKIRSPNFRELHVYLSRYMLAKIFEKNMDAWYPQIVPGVWSLVTLYSAAAALKHLRSALRCWSLLASIGQFWHKSTV